MQIDKQHINVSEIAHKVSEQVKELAAHKNITLNTDITPEIYVEGDEILISGLIFNLKQIRKDGKQKNYLLSELWLRRWLS